MSAYAGLRNIILIGTLFGFHGLLNRSLLIDGVNEIFIVTSRISVVTLLIGIYCFREFISSISVEYFLKGSLSGILAIFIPGWAFIMLLNTSLLDFKVFSFLQFLYSQFFGCFCYIKMKKLQFKNCFSIDWSYWTDYSLFLWSNWII